MFITLIGLNCQRQQDTYTAIVTLVLTSVGIIILFNSCCCMYFANHLCPGEATATGGDITLKTVKDATWDARAKWDHLAINLDVDSGTIDVSIGLCYVRIVI